MNDIQRTVDELRFIIQRQVIEQSDELTALVASYSGYCHEVNARLRRCDECVKQGLRSEALQLAESKPNLLDAVAILDFPERQELIDVVNMYFMKPPEPLLIDVAAALNEAYADHAPLERLLEDHRMLALGRAPLAQRLSVLRSLADLDFSSQHWDHDIREMEKARFRELEADSIAASKIGDSDTLNTLSSEIQAPVWREPIPTSLSRALKSRTQQTVRDNARQRIMELNEQLHFAFSALDAAKAKALREEWNKNRRLMQATDDDPLVEQVQPIFDWLDDEERKAAEFRAFSKCLAEIERAIENEEVTAEDLRRLKLTADRFERSLPTMLETRYRSRIGALEFNERRRKTFVIGAVVGVCAIVFAVFGLVTYASVEGDKTRRLVAATTEMIDEGKLHEAQKLVDQHAAQATSEAWLNVKKKLAEAVQAEKDRTANLHAQMTIARESPELLAIEAALKQARNLASTTDEKIELGQLQASWQKRSSDALAQRDRTFRETLTSASSALKTLDETLALPDTRDPNQIRLLQEAVEKQLALLLQTRNAVSNELGSQFSVLESRFKLSQQSIADRTKKGELLERLTESVLMLPENSHSMVQPQRYSAIVTEFIEALPRDPQVVAMKAAIEFNPFPATLGYQILIKQWGHLKPNDKNDVDSRIKALRAFVTEHPQSPDRDLLGQYESWLTSVSRRFEENGDAEKGAQKRLVALFNSKFIKEWQVLQDNAGHTYYLQSTPAFGSLTKINYLVGFNGESDHINLKTENLLTTKPISAPHQEIAVKARTMLRSVAIDQWRDTFQELIETLMKAEKIDPFLRYLLVLKTVECAARGDHFLTLELAPVLAKLNDEEIDRSVPWMDPKSKSAEKARTRAKEVLSSVSIETIESSFTAAGRRQAQFEQVMFAPRFSVGWLEKKSGDEWACRTKWSATGAYTLYVVSRPNAMGLRNWLQAGQVRNNSFSVDPTVAGTVGEASIIFASTSSTDPKTALVREK